VRIVGWAMVAVWMYSAMRLVMRQCPRCKGQFHAKPLPNRRGRRGGLLSERRCMNCGLLRP
jgi:hypothetical protein